MLQGLPCNGPAITRPLIRMINALSDGMMIFVIFIVSVVVLIISVLCIHFILSIQMSRDRKEVGMLKALGIGRKDVRKIYFTKYLLFSLIGTLLGLAAALLIQKPMMKQLCDLYGTGRNYAASAIIILIAAVLAQGIILLSIRHSLKKTDKLSALDALFRNQKKGKNLTQYVLIGAVAAACTFLMLGSLWGEGLCGLVLQYFGAYGFRFVIDPISVFLVIPLLSLVMAAIAIKFGIKNIKDIKAFECCTGKE